MARHRPLIAHVVHRFDVGGMENGVVNLINGLPEGLADHAIIALTEASPVFSARIQRPDIRIVELHKGPGQTARILPRMYRVLRQLRPAVFHTRNVATLETQLAAWLARVPVRIHGEHGWDMHDLDGANTRMQLLRRAMRPFVHHQIALSRHTEDYLIHRVGVPRTSVTRICNGVDTEQFAPATDRAAVRRSLEGWTLPIDAIVVGAVGRLAEVKNLPLMLRACARIRARHPHAASRLNIAVIGDGPQGPGLRALAAELGLDTVTWFAGARRDVAGALRAMDVLCQPSLAEGISNTVLEAMAAGLPVVATAVGGTPELVEDGVTGALVASGDEGALTRRLEEYVMYAVLRKRHGAAARRRVVTQFSLETMLSKYDELYSRHLARAGLVHPDDHDAVRLVDLPS